MNLCRRCKQDFSSISMFDRHRVGKHEYLWSLDQEDGRRCLDVEELEGLGLRLDKHGRWCDPTHNPGARLRARHKLAEAS